MKKFFLSIILVSVLLLASCSDYLTFGPANIITGSYVHNLGGGTTDFYIELNEDGSGYLLRTDGSGEILVDKEITYSYRYTYFSFERAEGVISIEGYKDFLFSWHNNKNYYDVWMTLSERNQNGAYVSYEMIPGEVK